MPIPSEEDVRSIRQLPIEIDPPEHSEYRKIVEPFFKRAKNPEVIEKVEALIDRMIDTALAADSIEIVDGFALPIQSHALTYLLDVPEAEAEIWLAWGMHVFTVGGSPEENGQALENYIDGQLDRARKNPGDDFFSALTKATYRGAPLTREEMHGFANLTFAGGRDTVIKTISGVVGYLAGNPKALEFLREDPKRVVNAYREYFSGYDIDPMSLLNKTFDETEGYDEMVVLKDIPFASHCEHHIAPIIGKVHIAYLPKSKVVGISKLARLVEVYSRRLQIQEKMTTQVANTLNEVLDPIGVAVVIEAAHECMTTRGINKPEVNMVTSRMLGAFRDDPTTRREFLSMIGSPSSHG